MRAPGDAVRIALVDDHMLVREGLREILAAEEGFEVVAEAGDSGGALAVVEKEKPDIVLLDVEIPGAEVTATVRGIRTISPLTRVIILSMYDGSQLVQSLLRLGVNGYLHKSITRLGLIAAIRSASMDDERIVVSVLPHSLVHAQSDVIVLTLRECEVLQLVAYAMSNAQVGNRLSLTEATVKRHLRNVFVKLGAVSRIDAVNKAVAASLIEPSSHHPPGYPEA